MTNNYDFGFYKGNNPKGVDPDVRILIDDIYSVVCPKCGAGASYDCLKADGWKRKTSPCADRVRAGANIRTFTWDAFNGCYVEVA
jgi:hypothetical protein